jgi:hypothetical protein
MHRALRLLLGLLLAMQAFAALAQTRAWLDRDRIALGEDTTLNIETDQATVAAPDYSALMAEFEISNNVSSRQFELINGVSNTRVLFAVALRPRREGLLRIPTLLVGNQRTEPLTLSVTAPSSAPAHAGDPVFVESEADSQSPYVQQAVGLIVRLYYSGPISGQLDQPEPEGATLQRVGDDVQYARQIGNREYTVLERHYLLIPERSGTLTIPGAHFQGSGADGFFDDLIGNGGRPLHADSPPRFLQVREAPANAPQPWLPLRAMTLRYLDTPRSARAGEAVTVTVEATADGTTAAQMPALQLVTPERAQVFAEPAQNDETFTEGRPHVRLVRRFSIVPTLPGSMRISGPSIVWWDVRAGLARTAALPDLTVQVAPGAAGATSATPGNAVAAVDRSRGAWRGSDIGPVQPWAVATVVFAGIWLLTLMWALRHRPEQTAAKPVTDAREPPAVSLGDLKRALAQDDLGRVADVLCALASPPAADLDELRRALGDSDQVAAVDALQRARWGQGDGTFARSALRAAFKQGPIWKHSAKTQTSVALPPLYPPER